MQISLFEPVKRKIVDKKANKLDKEIRCKEEERFRAREKSGEVVSRAESMDMWRERVERSRVLSERHKEKVDGSTKKGGDFGR